MCIYLHHCMSDAFGIPCRGSSSEGCILPLKPIIPVDENNHPLTNQVNGLLEHMLRLRFGTDKVRFVDCNDRCVHVCEVGAAFVPSLPLLCVLSYFGCT